MHFRCMLYFYTYIIFIYSHNNLRMARMSLGQVVMAHVEATFCQSPLLQPTGSPGPDEAGSVRDQFFKPIVLLQGGPKNQLFQ